MRTTRAFIVIELLVVVAILPVVAAILHDVASNSPCADYVASLADPHWGGPHLRHNERSNNAFLNSHLDAMRSSRWYYGNSPWLKPDVGGL